MRLESSSAPADESSESASMATQNVALTVNGRLHILDLDPRTTLLDALREHLALTGTKKGCDQGQCGACTVIVNGQRINSCLSLAVMHAGDEIVTVEGLMKGDDLHPMQAAFVHHDGLQCGYCTPGQICSAVALLGEHEAGWPSYVTADLATAPALTDAEIAERMSGNICRCSAYPGRLTVELAMTDTGTGSYTTILTQIVAQTMELPIDRVTVRLGDTRFPPTAGSGGSFGAATSGAAVLAACRKLKAGLASGITEVEGSVTPAELNHAYSHAGFGAHFAEVAVDRDTGEVSVRRMLGVFAAGRILNAKTARSQMIGGMTWGIGSALIEENHVDPRYGSFINQDLAGYHVAVNADVGAMEVLFLDEADPDGSPLGAKGTGELGICGAGAAVINAIHNAIGARIRDFPATPDKLLPALEALDG
jgi:aerobic-type carbon monoxide dehydrogenase small subunit (CoxS/CutS family)